MNTVENSFLDERDFIDCLNRGCEIAFLYGNKEYSITHTSAGICIMEFYNEESEMLYPDAKLVLDYPINGKTLKDILLDIKVTDRSF